MNKFIKLFALILVFSLFVTGTALPAAAAETSEIDPCAEVGPGYCVYCGSANVTSKGYEYVNVGSGDCDGGYNHIYVFRVYLCNSCGMTTSIYDHCICEGAT